MLTTERLFRVWDNLLVGKDLFQRITGKVSWYSAFRPSSYFTVFFFSPILLLLQLWFLVLLCFINHPTERLRECSKGVWWLPVKRFLILVDYFLSSSLAVLKCHSYLCFYRKCKLLNLFWNCHVPCNCELDHVFLFFSFKRCHPS